jgi:hypothetical protein
MREKLAKVEQQGKAVQLGVAKRFMAGSGAAARKDPPAFVSTA